MQLSQIASLVGGTLNGEDIDITSVSGLDNIQDSTLSFAENESSLSEAEKTSVKALLVPLNLKAALPYVTVANPRVAFARLLAYFYPRQKPKAGIHKTAVVNPGSEISPLAYIGPFAQIGQNCRIGDNVEIYAGVYVGDDCVIDSATRLMPGVVFNNNCKIGKDCLVGALTVLNDNTSVGDDVEIGARCILDGCTISNGVRIDNLVNIKKDTKIGNFAILISQMGTGCGAQLGDFVIAASQSYVNSGVSVGSGAQIGGRSYVADDIPPGQKTWSGDPVLEHKDDLRRQAARQFSAKNVKTLKKYVIAKRKGSK